MSETVSALTPETVKVGDGVTFGVGSDRVACTVTHVNASGKTIRFTRDNATPNAPIHDREQYDYSYESVPETESVDPMGETTTNASSARWNSKRERFMYLGRPLMVGRHQFYDPHF